MILKLMSDSILADSDPAKPCRIIGDVRHASYYVNEESGLPYIGVTYKDGTSEKFAFYYKGNAYLMDDTGKTVQTFHQPDVIDEELWYGQD